MYFWPPISYIEQDEEEQEQGEINNRDQNNNYCADDMFVGGCVFLWKRKSDEDFILPVNQRLVWLSSLKLVGNILIW